MPSNADGAEAHWRKIRVLVGDESSVLRPVDSGTGLPASELQNSR